MVNSLNMAESGHLSERLSVIEPAVNSEICKKLISLTDDAYCTIKLFQSIFIHQPVLVASLLRIANSMGYKTPILSLSESISILGWKKVRGIISAICLTAVNKEPNPALYSVWQQTSLRTIIAKLLTNSRDEQLKEKIEKCCYVYGLGRFYLAAEQQNKYLEVLDLVRSECNINEAEQAKFGYTSTSISPKLCNNFRLPELFSSMIDDCFEGRSFEVIAQAELLSITLLYQPQELEKVRAKLNISNLDTVLDLAINEHQFLKKLSCI